MSRSPGSARQAARARRADDEPAESSTASRGAAVNRSSISTAGPNDKYQYRGKWHNYAQCARDVFEVKKKVKHSSEYSRRLARQPINSHTMVAPAHNDGQASSSISTRQQGRSRLGLLRDELEHEI